MNWKTKAHIQNALSALPGGGRCNYLLQRAVGQLRSDTTIDGTFEQDVTVLLERMGRLDLDPRKSRILEIGTGWLPVLPLSLALAGFSNIITVDINLHLREKAVRRTLLALQKHLGHPLLSLFATADQVQQNYLRLLHSDHILPAAGITYQAPCNAGATKWPSGSIDLIVSNNVFEHVPVPGLISLFAEAKRLLRPGGSVLHCVNCGDHYAYADKSVSQVNYLKFSETEWKRWNNSIHYQNRLRPIDFIEMAEHGGLQLQSAEYSVRPEYLALLDTIEIAPEFHHYSRKELAATSLTLIASS